MMKTKINLLITMLLAFLIFPLTLFAQEKVFSVKIKAPKADAKSKIYFNYHGIKKNINDSCSNVDGYFSFKGVTLEPVLIYLTYSHDGVWIKDQRKTDRTTISVRDGETEIVVKDSLKNANLSVSAIQKDYLAYKNNTLAVEKIQADLSRQLSYENPVGKVKDSLLNLYREYTDKRADLQLKYAESNPGSFFNLMAIEEIGGYVMENPERILPTFNKLSPEVKATPKGKSLGAQILASVNTTIGRKAPGFTINDTNGKPVSLSDFAGKYVLVDFWASWCGPCRNENKNVIAVFDRYKSKNFTVLGISIDSPGQRDAWLKAIEDDKLTWTNVSDLTGFSNSTCTEYGIKAIPQNFLVDPTGKIVGKNLRGERLEKKLAEVL